MREILFRGKRTDKQEWVVGDSIVHSMYKKGDVCIGVIEGLSIYSVIPESVSEFTGLTDKKGTKIFEGDIVKVEYTGVNKGLEGIAKVVFEKCKFALVWGWHNEIVGITDFCNVIFKVIGNIHDNPNLLKSEVTEE